MRIKRVFVSILIVGVTFAMIIFPGQGMVSARYALTLCADTVLPTLFPFFVLSSFMIQTGFAFCLGTVFAPFSKRIFSVSGAGAVVFVIGLLCGYPTGAKMTAELYKNGDISKNEAERLLPFCNNSGPLFLIGAVGTGMLRSTKTGVLLYVIHVVSALLVGVFFSFFAKHEASVYARPFSAVPFGKAVSDSVRSGAETALFVCGFVVFFAVIRSYFVAPVTELFGIFGTFFVSLFEVTAGAQDICTNAASVSSALILLSGAVGFGGLCVFFQVCSAVNGTDLSVIPYFLGKLMQGALSMIFMWLYTDLTKATMVLAQNTSVTERYYTVLPCLIIAVLFAIGYAASKRRI